MFVCSLLQVATRRAIMSACKEPFDVDGHVTSADKLLMSPTPSAIALSTRLSIRPHMLYVWFYHGNSVAVLCCQRYVNKSQTANLLSIRLRRSISIVQLKNYWPEIDGA